MKKRKLLKRGLASLLAVVLAVGLLPMMPGNMATVKAADVEGDSYSFNADTGELFIKNDSGTTAWRADERIQKDDVKSVEFQRLKTPVLNIGANAFDGCTNLSGTIKLNAQTASIGADAFKGCNNLEVILLPKAVQESIQTAGIPQNTAYVVYEHDNNTGNFVIHDIVNSAQKQIVFDGMIYNGTTSWSGCSLVAEERFRIVPSETSNSGRAWYYRKAEDGGIVVTKYLPMVSGNYVYGGPIELPKTLAGCTVNEFSDTAFSDTRLDASHIFVTDESTRVTLPENVSKIIISEENGKKEAYFTPGNVGTVDTRYINVPIGVETLFAKDIILGGGLMDLRCPAVSYKEDGNGYVIITDVTLGDLLYGAESYTVPTSIKGSPVTTVMINTKDKWHTDKIIVDESVNKIVCEYYNSPSSADTPVITKVTQGSAQDTVAIPATIGGRAIATVTENVFDDSVECVIVPDGTEVSVPYSVGKITYQKDENGTITITEVIPGRDNNGEKKLVSIPETIGGSEPVMSDDVKKDMQEIPHTHHYVCGICKICNYSKAVYTIVATAGEHGSVSPQGVVSVTEGESKSFTIVPAEGYDIDTITVDGNIVQVMTTYTFTDVQENHTIEVTFKQESQTPDVTAPSITTQPGNATVKVGETATFTLAASGTALTYQWQIDRNDGNGWVNIAGANEASYTTSTVNKSYSGFKYQCVVSNSAGTVTSNTAVLTVTENNIPDPDPVDYEILDGANSNWEQNSDGSLSIRGSGALYKFVGVKVDGTLVDAKNYTVKEGSTIVTLKADYLNTLSVGTHTFEILWTDGSASTTFTSKADSSDNGNNNQNDNDNSNRDDSVLPDDSDQKEEAPKTGDDTPSVWLFILTIISGTGLILTAKKRRKNLKMSEK
ncbi:MAG: leucine-rich repeat protein [Lachnobacterium sp.]|nr:leucine-rich repeat protein [Lachnobacterium sp.]